MRWKYIKHGELPGHGDLCLISGIALGTDGYTIGRYNEDLEQFTNRDEIIKQKYVYKWVKINEIENDIECDDDGLVTGNIFTNIQCLYTRDIDT